MADITCTISPAKVSLKREKYIHQAKTKEEKGALKNKQKSKSVTFDANETGRLKKNETTRLCTTLDFTQIITKIKLSAKISMNDSNGNEICLDINFREI